MRKRLTVITSLAVTFGCAFVLATTNEPGAGASSRASRTPGGVDVGELGDGATSLDQANPAHGATQSAGVAGVDAPIQNGPPPGSDTYRVLEEKGPSGHDRVRSTTQADPWRNASSCTDTQGVLHARKSMGFQTCVNEKRKHDRDAQQGGQAAPETPILVPNGSSDTGIPLGGKSRGSSATEN